MRLKDDVAIVTGGGSGIGRGTCVRLAEEGATVAVFDVDLDGAQGTVREIEAAGGRALALRVDVSQAAEVEAAVKEVVSAFGPVDVLVNNAGVSTTIPVAKMTEEEWDRTIDVNMKGTFLCCRAVIPAMKENGGYVIGTDHSIPDNVSLEQYREFVARAKVLARYD